MINDKVKIEDYCDGFAIIINSKRFYFDQEDNHQQLIDVFNELGIKDITYEEVY